MDLNKLFRTFKRKLIWEGILKAGIYALMLAAASIFLTSLIYHILIEKTPIEMLVGVGVCVFFISFLLKFFVLHYPTKKRIATRIDELGLQERIGTMLEFQKDESDMVKLQREDATFHLQNVTSKQMKIRLSKKAIILCAVSVTLAITMLIIPYDIFDFSEPTELTEEERAEIIQELIDELREEIEESELPEELKEELNEIVDKLERELEESDTELEQAAKIEQAKKEMEELLDQAMEENPEMKEAIEEMKEQLEDTMEEKKNEILGNGENEVIEEPENSEESEEEQNQEGEASEGENQGDMPQGENQGSGQYQEGGSGGGDTMTEGIYDPTLGNVPYGEVFAIYYAEYLEALEAGEVPEDLQKIMDQYFALLE